MLMLRNKVVATSVKFFARGELPRGGHSGDRDHMGRLRLNREFFTTPYTVIRAPVRNRDRKKMSVCRNATSIATLVSVPRLPGQNAAGMIAPPAEGGHLTDHRTRVQLATPVTQARIKRDWAQPERRWQRRLLTRSAWRAWFKRR
jgi:hypothetical protein